MGIPIAAIERVAKAAGVERMGQDALVELQKTLDEIAGELAFEATQAAKHAGRKTVSAEDVWLVSGKQKA